MMKGNEEDCICEKNPEHTEECDAYRLSQFIAKMASVSQRN